MLVWGVRARPTLLWFAGSSRLALLITIGSAFYAAGTAVRIKAEDALMAATFGDAFEDYRRRVPAVVPRFAGR